MPEGINLNLFKGFFLKGAEKSKEDEKADGAHSGKQAADQGKRQVAQVKSDGNGVRASMIMYETGKRASVTMHENPLFRQPMNEAPLHRGSLVMNANPLFGAPEQAAPPQGNAPDIAIRQRKSSESEIFGRRESSGSNVFGASPEGAVAASKGGALAQSRGHINSLASQEQIEGAVNGDFRPRMNSFDSEELYEPMVDEGPVFTNMKTPAAPDIENQQIKGDEPQFTKMGGASGQT